jgi:hypothetical protein
MNNVGYENIQSTISYFITIGIAFIATKGDVLAL